MYDLDGSDVPRSWYALYTRHQHEKRIAEILSRKGVEVFLPVYPAVHRWKDRLKRVSLPLFPCYVFVRDGLDRRLQILMTPGVHTIVANASGPVPIPEAEMDAVRLVTETFLHVEPHPFLKCGDWVRIESGPLEGLEGILVRKKTSLRLVLSVELLQKSVAVEVDASVVEPVNLQTMRAYPCAGLRSDFSTRRGLNVVQSNRQIIQIRCGLR